MEQQLIDELRARFAHLKDFIKQDFRFSTAPAQLTNEEVSDQIVQLRELKSMIEAREKMMGEVLKSRLAAELGEVKEAYLDEGNKYPLEIPGIITPGIQYEYVVQKRLDGEAVKEEMGTEWYEEHTKMVDFFQARVLK